MSSLRPPPESYDPSSTTSTKPKYKFRYSGDLELPLHFDRDPSARPSATLKDTHNLWRQVQSRTFDDSTYTGSFPTAENRASSYYDSYYDEGTSSRGDINSGMWDNQTNDNDDFYDDDRYSRPNTRRSSRRTTQMTDATNTRKSRTASVFSTFFQNFTAKVTLSQNERQQRDNPHGYAPPTPKKPSGPRDMSGKPLSSKTFSYDSSSYSDSPPISIQKVWYTQPRIIVSIFIAFFSILSLALSSNLLSRFITPTNTPSFFLILFTGSLAAALSIASILLYLFWAPTRQWADAQCFLICESIDSAASRQQVPSPWVPLLDLLLYILSLGLWMGTLTDFGFRGMECLQRIQPNNNGRGGVPFGGFVPNVSRQGFIGGDMNVCIQIWSGEVAGILAGCGVFVVVGWKVWELVMGGVWRKVVKRGVV
ncbi:hypothetical protein HDV05_001597 [Chytridiales sp. JEL 0842]|nr:hypothetical protein HDV05_001597 [Chytridiales sp. JEL 0842]